ncbi:MAG: HAD-IA family hydrolase [Butyricimonas faecihominis]
MRPRTHGETRPGNLRLDSKSLSLKPEECLFIDDLEPNVKAAQAIGINTVHFTDRHKGYEEIRERLKEKKQRATL